MISIMSKSPNARPTPHMLLDTIWKVEADESYHARYSINHPNNTIAIKTVGGIGLVEVNGTVHRLTKGSLLIFRYADMSYYKPERDEWDFYWFEFEGGSQVLPMGVIVDCELEEDDIPTMELCFSTLSFPAEAAYISAVFSAMLMRWLRGYKTDTSVGDSIISASVNYIINNIGKPLSISALAAEYHVGERTYRELFKQHMGLSPQEYITGLRMRNAEELLLTTSLTIKEIAISLGFTNQYYFANFFKKRNGSYPSTFRKMAKTSRFNG